MPDDDDEPVTQPDLARFTCPNCKGQGEIHTTTWDTPSSHSTLRTVCPTCWGVKTIDREAMARWKARSGQ
jgi:DnaJ-class molecular chaperone